MIYKKKILWGKFLGVSDINDNFPDYLQDLDLFCKEKKKANLSLILMVSHVKSQLSFLFSRMLKKYIRSSQKAISEALILIEDAFCLRGTLQQVLIDLEIGKAESPAPLASEVQQDSDAFGRKGRAESSQGW